MGREHNMVDNSDVYGNPGPRSAANQKLRRRLYDRDGRAAYERLYAAHCDQLLQDYGYCTSQGWRLEELTTKEAIDWFSVELKTHFEVGNWSSSLNKYDHLYFRLAFDDCVEAGHTIDERINMLR